MSEPHGQHDYVDTDGVVISLTNPSTRALYAAVTFLLAMIEAQASNSVRINTLPAAQPPVGDSNA